MIYKEILAKMLEGVPNILDKRKGSFMHLISEYVWKDIEKYIKDVSEDSVLGGVS